MPTSSLILSYSYHVGTLYIHVLVCFFSFVSCVHFIFAKHQKTKNISFISLAFEFVVLVYFIFRFGLLFKNPKRFCFVCLFLSMLALIRKPKNICCSSAVLYSCFRSSKFFVVPLGLGYHFTSFKPHKWKAIMTIYDNQDVVRGWYELYLFFIFVNIPTHVYILSYHGSSYVI